MNPLYDIERQAKETFVLLDVEVLRFINDKEGRSNYLPVEISYIIFDIQQIYEIFSSRLKYDFTKYDTSLWIGQYNYAKENFLNVIRSKKLISKHKININDNKIEFTEEFKELCNSKTSYKSDYGLDAIEVKDNLLEKIEKYDLIPMAKGVKTEYNFLYNDFDVYVMQKQVDSKKIIELEKFNILKYDEMDRYDKIKCIKLFYDEYKDKISMNNGIVDNDKFFSLYFLDKFVDLHFSIYEIIMFYKHFISYMQGFKINR